MMVDGKMEIKAKGGAELERRPVGPVGPSWTQLDPVGTCWTQLDPESSDKLEWLQTGFLFSEASEKDRESAAAAASPPTSSLLSPPPPPFRLLSQGPFHPSLPRPPPLPLPAAVSGGGPRSRSSEGSAGTITAEVDVWVSHHKRRIWDSRLQNKSELEPVFLRERSVLISARTQRW